jgi:hypothetical protein
VRVGSAPGLGQRERAEDLAAAHGTQPHAALLVGAEPVDRVRTEPDGGLDGDRDRRVGAPELLEAKAEGRQIGPEPADLLGEREAEDAELAEAPDDLERERARAVVLGGGGRDDLGRERADGVAERELVLGQVEVHPPPTATSAR